MTAELGLLTVLLTSDDRDNPVGIISAIRPGTFLDGALRIVTISGISVPNFWVATLVITLPAIWWAWTPLWEYVRFEDDPLNNLKIVIWPAITLAIATAAYVARIVRSSMLETLYSDYVRTARAEGPARAGGGAAARVPQLDDRGDHGDRHPAGSGARGGSVIAEQIFGIPGLGLLVFESVVSIDYTGGAGGDHGCSPSCSPSSISRWTSIYTFVDPRIPVLMTQTTEAAAALSQEAMRPQARRGAGVLRFLQQQRLGTIGAVLIILMVIGAVAAPVLRTSDPEGFGVAPILEGPSGSHFFGTNLRGAGCLVAGALRRARLAEDRAGDRDRGGAGGHGAGAHRGLPRRYRRLRLRRVADVLIAFPSILFALTLHASLRDELPNLGQVLAAEEFLLVVAICIVFTPVIFRIMRGNVLEQRAAIYVESARVIGASETRIMWRHIFPNLVGLLLIVMSTTLPAAILTESALSFLGVGVEQGTPSWGADLSGSNRTYFVRAPWIAIFPGLALSVTVLAFNLFGDALRDTLDPRLRGQR